MEVWKEFDHNGISHSAAHHLMAIDDLVGRKGYARVSDVARQLDITRGSVSISLRPLKDAGLVLQDENRHLQLSDGGQRLVDAIKTKRRLMQRFLTDVLGMEAGQAEIDACKMEHLLSNDAARRLLSFLRFLDTDSAAPRQFFTAWHEFDPSCSHDSANCASCDAGGGCMADRVATSTRLDR